MVNGTPLIWHTWIRHGYGFHEQDIDHPRVDLPSHLPIPQVVIIPMIRFQDRNKEPVAAVAVVVVTMRFRLVGGEWLPCLAFSHTQMLHV